MTSSEFQQLTEYLARQFAAVDRRFVSIDGRLAVADDRFAAIDRRFDALEERFDARFREAVSNDLHLPGAVAVVN